MFQKYSFYGILDQITPSALVNFFFKRIFKLVYFLIK